VGFVLSSKQIEYKPKRFKGVVIYNFGDIVFKLTDKGVLIFNKDETYQDKDILINGRKVASGRSLGGTFVHTGIKARPWLDEEDILNLIRQRVKSNCPEGCLRIENLYYDPDTKEIVIKTE